METPMWQRGESDTARGPAALLPWAALAAIYFVWGTVFLAIRVGVQEIPPFLIGAGRYLAAAAILALIAFRVEPRTHIPIGHWRRYCLAGVAMFLGGNGLVCWGELHVPSGIAAVLNATIPLWMVMVEVGRRRIHPSWGVAAGVTGGVLGVAILVRPSPTQQLDMFAAGAILLAAACWAVGSLWVRDEDPPAGPLTVASVQMAAGGLALLIVSILTGELSSFNPAAVSAGAWLALAWLILPAGVMTFGSYQYALRVWPSHLIATYPFVNSVVAVGLGWLLLAEPITERTLLGCGIVLASAALIAFRAVPRREVVVALDPGPAERSA
jgi:drug/metabolite transporter (DMT)-like permease